MYKKQYKYVGKSLPVEDGPAKASGRIKYVADMAFDRMLTAKFVFSKVPHGKIKKIENLIVSFGRSLDGVDFQSMDGKPTHIIFLLIAPETSAGIHLKALARISRLLKDSAFRRNIMGATTSQEIYDIIAQEDEKY